MTFRSGFSLLDSGLFQRPFLLCCARDKVVDHPFALLQISGPVVRSALLGLQVLVLVDAEAIGGTLSQPSLPLQCSVRDCRGRLCRANDDSAPKALRAFFFSWLTFSAASECSGSL